MPTEVRFGLSLLLAAACLSVVAAAPNVTGSALQQLEMIPQPHQVQLVGSGFTPATAAVIRVSDTPADRFAAVLLRDALHETYCVDCDVTTTSSGAHELSLSTAALLEPLQEAVPAGQEKEGYTLRVNDAGIAIAAKSDAGLFYGVQTLIQLVEQSARNKTEIPGMVIVDWPTFGLRVRYFDGSQYLGTVVPRRANLEREIKLLARYKLNGLVMDLYNLVPFKSFPYCADSNTLSLSDWQDLVEMAHRYHVMLIPSFQSFAQIYQVIWTCDEGKPYREEPAAGLICPSRPENVQFLQGLYKDLMSVFKYSPVLGIGCSEVGMQWQERYCPRCRKRLDAGETLHDIYYKHVQNCSVAVEAVAKELGRAVRPMMWADEFYMGYDGKRWVGIENIPKNVVMGHWQYWGRYQVLPGHKDYDGIAGLLQRGFDVFFVTASFEFNTYLHDLSPEDPKDGKWEYLYDSGIYNVAEQTRWALVHHQQGHPGKVLGGGCATFSQHDIRGWDSTWYAFALQGEYAWGDPVRPFSQEKEGYTDRFAATFYKARDQEAARTIAAAYRDLDAAKSDIERNNYLIRDIIGEYDIHDASYINNDLAQSLKLIDELSASPKGPGKTIADVRARAESVLRVAKSYRPRLAALASRVGNTYSLHYLISAAHKIENHAVRTLYMIDQEQVLAGPGSAPAEADKNQFRQKVDDLAKRLDALRRDTQLIADEMDQLAFGAVQQLNWAGVEAAGHTVELAGDTTGYHKVLASLAAFQARLNAARDAK